MLDAGADFRSRDENGMALEHVAAHRGSAESLNILEAAREAAEREAEDRIRWWVVLLRACKTGDANAARRALARGARPRHDETNSFPLELAADSGSAAVLREILARWPLSEGHRAEATRALHIAALRCDKDSVEALLKAGVRIGARTATGRSALEEAALEENQPAVELLKSLGADIEERSPKGLTPLLAAAKDGRSDAARFLVRMGASPLATDPDGRGAADLARSAGAASLADFLVEKLAKAEKKALGAVAQAGARAQAKPRSL